MIVDAAAVQALDARYGTFVPTGAATAARWRPRWSSACCRGVRATLAGGPGERGRAPSRAARPTRTLILLAVACLLAVTFSVAVGRTDEGWSWPGTPGWDAAWPWRGPRTAVAFAAGAALGLAGGLLQRSTGNLLASPESLGLGAAVMVGVSGMLVLDPAPSAAMLMAAGAGGAFLLLALLTLTGLRARFAPEQMLLSGVALCGALNAVVIIFLSFNDARAATLTGWLAGSTAAFDGRQAALGLAGVAVLVPLVLALSRPLDLLPLGEPTARGAGVALGPVRFALMVAAALLTAGAVLAVGPLTFVGLLAPQLAARLGFARSATHLPGAALCGGLVMVLADWAGRVVAAPFEVPAGLMASLIGIPVLIVLLARRPSTS